MNTKDLCDLRIKRAIASGIRTFVQHGLVDGEDPNGPKRYSIFCGSEQNPSTFCGCYVEGNIEQLDAAGVP
jgi:hypothetical protein